MKSPKSYLLVLLALTTVGGAALAWHQYQELVELRAAAVNKDERAALQKKLWDLEKANRELADQLAALRAESGDMEGMIAAAGGDQPPRDRGGRGPNGPRGGRSNNLNAQEAALQALFAKPEVQAMIDQQRKLALDQRYSALFRSLNLSPEQADKLKTLLAERQSTRADVMAVAREQGIDPQTDRDGFRKLFNDAQNELNNSIKAVIGENGFSALQNYEQTMPQRNLVDQLQQRLSYSSSPLSQTQADQLVQILAANSPPRPVNPNGGDRPGGGGPGGPGGFGGGGPGGPGGFGGGRGGPDIGALAGVFLGGGGGGGGGFGQILDGGGRGGNAVTITPAVVNQSQGVLSAPQLSALQQLQQQQQSTQQLRQLVTDTIGANQPGTKAGNGPNGGANNGNGGGGRKRGGGG